jgi:hypothetical protein
MDLFIILDPISSFLFHLFHDFISLIFQDFCLDDFTSCFEIIHVLHAGLSPLVLSILHSFNGITHFFLRCHRPTSHSKEEELFLTDGLNLFSCKDTFNTLLNKKSCSIFFLFRSLLLNNALTNLFL